MTAEQQPGSRQARRRPTRVGLTVMGLLVVLLAAAVFTLGSLNVPIAPRTRGELVVLFALSTFLIAAFLVFLVIFGRALLRAWVERRAGQPGSRFKWKMVMGALAISLLPIVFMFFISYGLWNRSLNKWFPLPLETATAESQQLLRDLEARVLPADSPEYVNRRAKIERQLSIYEAQKQGLRDYKTTMLLALGLFTVVLLFSVTWFALFLSKLVTVPIQSLAEATREVSRGNFAHRVEVQATDELGTLVGSFNDMTSQLGESRRQIDEFTRNLEVALEELERRRQLLETVLENIPTAVLSTDPEGTILRSNSAVPRMFGERTPDSGARHIEDLLGEETTRDVRQLMRKALRMGTASKELEIALPGRPPWRAAVTVSALGPRRANPGYVLVFDDLTELLRAQKAAAWQEVAQRIAHEIKNPLTPIQLSVQRLSRRVEQSADAGEELPRLVGECAALIEREVAALKSLVDEFSEFARFPAPKPVSADLNRIVQEALDVFNGRVEGIAIRTELAPALPPIKADPELLRRVFVNLIDNAAEALEGVPRGGLKQITVGTRLDSVGETFEIVVADTGHGIPVSDKDKLFLPHFSTRSRGTGLGLAIVSRIVTDHGGTIRAEDNLPTGARFIIRLPVTESAAVPDARGSNSPAETRSVNPAPQK